MFPYSMLTTLSKKAAGNMLVKLTQGYYRYVSDNRWSLQTGIWPILFSYNWTDRYLFRTVFQVNTKV